MINRGACQIVAIVVVLSSIATGHCVDPEEAPTLVLRDPIYIQGNENFTKANGVVAGNGTSSDPYVIEGWEINASTEMGILVCDAEVHFVIRDVFVHSGGWRYTAIALCNVTNALIENVTASGNYMGIQLEDASNSRILNSSLADNEMHIRLHLSNNVTIQNSNFTGGQWGAISTHGADNLTIIGNDFSDTSGIQLYLSKNAMIRENSISGSSWLGIYLEVSHDAVVKDNNLSGGYSGVELCHAKNSTIVNNTFEKAGIFLRCVLNVPLSTLNTHTIPTDNTVNGLPVYYHKDCDDLNVDGTPMGQLIVVNCTNVSVSNLQISNVTSGIQMIHTRNVLASANIVGSSSWEGIGLHYSRDITLTGNTVHSDQYPIGLYQSTNTTVVRNHVYSIHGFGIGVISTTNTTIAGNRASTAHYGGVHVVSSEDITIIGNLLSHNDHGIWLMSSIDVTITQNTILKNGRGASVEYCTGIHLFHNNFIDNLDQAFDDVNGSNSWDDGYPSGGNYWSSYTGIDKNSGANQDQPGSDGIGDTPHKVPWFSQDRYPLMSPRLNPDPPELMQTVLSGPDMENVTLLWSLSDDDGKGRESVLGYRIYRSLTYSPSGQGYQLAATLQNGTAEFTDSNSGEGNPNSYFYRVCAYGLIGNVSCDENQGAKFTRLLVQGQNLASVPLLLSNGSVAEVLKTASFSDAWFYDSNDKIWRSHTETKPYDGSLQLLNNTMGLWVNVTSHSNLTVAGLVPFSTDIQLRAGWNLVGFPSFNTEYTVVDLKADTGAIWIEGFDPPNPPHFLKALQDVDVLLAGYGYWTYVPADVVWTVGNT